MGESPAQPADGSDLPVAIELRADHMQVTVASQPGQPLKLPDVAAILARLTEMGVKLASDAEAQVHELCRSRTASRKAVIVSQGVAPIHDTPPTVELISPLDLTTPRNIGVDEPIARIVPGATGTDGLDVFGKPVPRRRCDSPPPVGDNVKLAADASTFIASAAGVLRVRRQGASTLIGVFTALTHQDDVTRDMGSMEYPGDLLIKGSIRGGSIVRAGGNVQVTGDVEADELLSGGDLRVDGAINARGQSQYTVAGDLRARAIQGARIDAGGDVTVATSIQQSRVACRGRLKVENDVINSHITASGGLACQAIGSANFSKSLIEVGIDDRLRTFAHQGVPEIAAHREKAARIRNAIAPLLRSATPLTPVQKNRVTALLFEADHLEYTADRMTLDLRAELELAKTRFVSEITIANTAFPGTTLRFPGVETTLRMAVKGPCRIAAQVVDGRMRILLFENGKPNGIPLELRQCNDDWLETITRAAA